MAKDLNRYFSIPCTLLVGMQNNAAAMENNMDIPQETENRTTIWSSNLTSSYFCKIAKIRISNWYSHTSVYCSTIHSSQDMEMSINGWNDKEKCGRYIQWDTIQP